MITENNGRFLIETDHTSYLFYVDPAGFLTHLYYGEKLFLTEDGIDAMIPVISNQNGCSIIADQKESTVSLDDWCQEDSSRGRGDLGQPMIELVYADGSRSSDFRFESFRIERIKEQPDGLPGAYKEEEQEGSSLVIVLRDQKSRTVLELVYSVFEECDCITRFARVRNEGEEPVRILRLMSTQLDVRTDGQQKILSFSGEWAREMEPVETILSASRFTVESGGGTSSNRANPFIIFGETELSETYGQCYGFNLLYSGNHQETLEIGGHGRARFLSGIHPEFLEIILQPLESFCSPEAVETFSDGGYQQISLHMHAFVREHIVRGYWKKKERPILINSWEAMYFDVREKKVLKLAKEAAKAGIELFVLDDGWFGKRNSDKEALGDWNDNTEKLPGGLAGLSERIHAMGMKFGIWVEPEMVSENSELYRAHPDYAVTVPGTEPARGRNQLLLDLTREEVQEYLIREMTGVFTRSRADYVKWDMNRNFSDYYSQALPAEEQGVFAHRYVLGLYRVIRELTERFPKILFEGCASGGNRFDLGMLCYMPQIWASDCTDALQRARIQNGYSYGYPQSVLGAHVSASPNHQTLRRIPLESRFAIACAGVLGYECNLSDLSAGELAEIREEVKLYKEWREVLQFGQFYRLKGHAAKGRFDTEAVRWNVVSLDGTRAVGITLQNQVLPNYSHRYLKTRGLLEDRIYHVYNRSLKYDIRRMGDLINTVSPIPVKQDSLLHGALSHLVQLDGEKEDHIVTGSILNKAGIPLASGYQGTGFEGNTAFYQDYDARIFLIEEAVPAEGTGIREAVSRSGGK